MAPWGEVQDIQLVPSVDGQTGRPSDWAVEFTLNGIRCQTRPEAGFSCECKAVAWATSLAGPPIEM